MAFRFILQYCPCKRNINHNKIYCITTTTIFHFQHAVEKIHLFSAITFIKVDFPVGRAAHDKALFLFRGSKHSSEKAGMRLELKESVTFNKCDGKQFETVIKIHLIV